MKVIFVICLQILVTYGITVPPSWPLNERIKLRQPSVASTAIPLNSEGFKFHSFFPENAQPSKQVNVLQYRQPNNQHLFVNHPQPTEQVQSGTKIKNNAPQSYQIVHFNKQDDVPIKQKIKVQNVPVPIRQHLTEVHPVEQSEVHPVVVPTKQNYKRAESNENAEENDDRSVEIIEHKEALSEYEQPKDVPTKPIYPGEGQWAKYGQKHRPYIRPDPIKEETVEIEKTAETAEREQTKEAEESRPEGYDTFEKGEEQFLHAQNAHNHKIKTTPSKIDSSETDSEPLYEKPSIGFVPEKLYTQVRRTETEQHLPRSAIDPEQEENAGRLREIIKDSKIHTVYTEEGYEDSAYDHAGHEKNAENHEGHAETSNDEQESSGRSRDGRKGKYSGEGDRRHGRNNLRRKIENNERSKNEDYNNSEAYKQSTKDDADTASSVYESRKINPASIIVPSKNIKKVTLKNGKNEPINMDIYTEVKYTPQKKKHKYVKITPSVSNKSLDSTEQRLKRHPLLKRIKRYDKDMLSKKYIRKRPKYYWKKIRTTTTPRPLITNRRKFESAFTTHSQSSNSQLIDEPDIEEPSEIISKPTKPVKTTTVSTIKLTGTNISTTEAPMSDSTTTISTTSTTAKQEFLHPDLLNPELTTRISKPSAPKVLPVKIRKFKMKRQKRYTNDFPNIKVDLKEFTDVETLPEPTKAPDLTHTKYPYYNLPVSKELNANSPLRYAEDMKNIPKKIENELSFYESREHIVCPEIPSEVNPIPERVQNQKEDEETNKMATTPDLPRLKGLGDKIDCLKVKYFGENPLDSPFFQEEIIEDPIPFFTITKTGEKVQKVSPDFIITSDKNNKKRELKIKILEPIVVLDEGVIESATVNPIHQNTEAVLKPPYTLTEMMTMNQEKRVKIKPKSIYDQISILEQNDEKPSNDKFSLPPTEKFIIIYDNQDAARMINITEMAQKNVVQPVVSTTVKPQESVRKPQIRKRPVNIIRKLPARTIKKPKTTIKSTTTSVPSTIVPITTIQPSTAQPTTTEQPTTKTDQPSPTTTKPLVVKTDQKPLQNFARPPVRPVNNWQTANRRLAAFYNIFDISRFLPKVPNHRLITSEVQYKDFIKPSEQMKVYSDVLQSINNEKENKDASDSKSVAVKVAVPQQNQDSPESAQETTEVIKSQEVNPQPSEIIIGMLPPSINTPYKTINTADSSSPSELTPQSSKHINYYYFIGMRPPNHSKSFTRHSVSKRDTKSTKKSKLEVDDLIAEESRFSSTYVTKYHHRAKRHLADPFPNVEDDLLMDETEIKEVYSSPPLKKPKVYTEIVRQRPARPTSEDPEEEEDLNPRKRIYEFNSNKPSTTSATISEEEIVEEVLTEAPEPTTTRKPVIYPVEANSEKPNIAQYISFIEKLHDKWAKEDATSTTEATTTTVTTQTVAESVNVRRGEPAYLQIINQLHEVRKEEDEKTTTTRPTEPSTSETYQPVPMKNSNPFILETFMSELNSMKAKLDPDNTAEGSNQETSSKNRNYSTKFKTNIDTSKYKTIERTPVNVRHNLSSRFNSDDELPLVKDKTTQTPMIIAIITRPSSTETPKLTTVVPDSLLEETTNQEDIPITTTVRPRQRGRPRRPVYSTTSTTGRPSTSTVNPIFRRRRPSRITTTSPASTTKIDSYFNRRRNRQKVETTTTPVTTTTETIVLVTPVSSIKENLEEPKKQRRFQKVQERHVMSEVTLTRFFEPSSDEVIDDNSEETKKHQYEVIGPLTHTDTLHGGNYKHEHDRKLPKASEEELTTIGEAVPFFTDVNLAENVNQLKESKEATTEKTQASNSLLTKEELAEKVVQKAKVSLYPNMARMVNRLAERKTEDVTKMEDSFEDEEPTEKPTFIKDPSRRMYYYAKL